VKRRLAVAGALLLAGLAPACAALAGLVLLSGCAAAPAPQVETRIQVERVTLPAGLLACESEPSLGDWTMQSGVADYVVRLHEAYADCSNTVSAIAQIETSAPPAPSGPAAAK
jgi:hypothetical protein